MKRIDFEYTLNNKKAALLMLILGSRKGNQALLTSAGVVGCIVAEEDIEDVIRIAGGMKNILSIKLKKDKDDEILKLQQEIDRLRRALQQILDTPANDSDYNVWQMAEDALKVKI